MRNNPYLNFRFKVEIDGLIEAGFQSVNGIKTEIKTHSQDEGGVVFTHILPMAKVEYDPITLKRGIGSVDVFSAWIKEAISGNFERKNGSIMLLDEHRETIVTWNFLGAFPSSWEFGELDASSDGDVLIETVILQHQGIEKV